MDIRTQLQNALRGVHVPELVRMQLRPVLREDQQPIVISGDHAIVARMRRSGGTERALRIPISAGAGETWPERYRVIAEDMPSTVRACFPDAIDIPRRGITIGGRTIPAVIMEWIDGPTLMRAVDRAASARRSEVLSALAEALKGFSDTLRKAGVVHGDLAADNLMVRPNGDVVAVDLDKLTWPGGPRPGIGRVSAAYRHPGMSATGAEQDAFAVLVQYVSLRILSDAPDLRGSFGDAPATHGGSLLFSAWDLTDPTGSRTFREARSQVSGPVRELVDSLRDACLGEASRVPDILASVTSGSPVRAAAETPTRREDPASSDWDLTRVIERIRAQGAPQEGESERHQTEVTSAYSQTVERLTPATVEEDRKQLKAAIERGDEADVIRLASRLSNDPIAQLYKIEVERILADGYVARISRAAKQHRDDTVISLAAEAESRNLPLDTATQRSARAARERRAARQKLESALHHDHRPELAEMAVSGELVVLGDTDRASLQRVLQALEWPILQQALESDDDALILEAFDEDIFEGEAGAPLGVHNRVKLARNRRAWLAETRAALKSRDVGTLGRLFADEPEGAAQRLSLTERNRVIRMLERESAIRKLEEAIQSGNDGRILKALQEVEEVGARIEDRQAWMSIRRVVERASIVEQIVAAGSADPIDDRTLARLLPLARMMGLRNDPALTEELSWDRLNAQVVRGAAARRIRRALETDDDGAIRHAAFPDLTGALDLLTWEERSRVEASWQ